MKYGLKKWMNFMVMLTEDQQRTALGALKKIADNISTLDDITYCCMAEEALSEIYSGIFPKFKCPKCKDWFHMPYKFCECGEDSKSDGFRIPD